SIDIELSEEVFRLFLFVDSAKPVDRADSGHAWDLSNLLAVRFGHCVSQRGVSANDNPGHSSSGAVDIVERIDRSFHCREQEYRHRNAEDCQGRPALAPASVLKDQSQKLHNPSLSVVAG